MSLTRVPFGLATLNEHTFHPSGAKVLFDRNGRQYREIERIDEMEEFERWFHVRCPDDIDEPQIGENIVIYNRYDDIKARGEVERFYLRPRGDRNSGHKNVSTTIGLMVLNCEMSSY